MIYDPTDTSFDWEFAALKLVVLGLSAPIVLLLFLIEARAVIWALAQIVN